MTAFHAIAIVIFLYLRKKRVLERLRCRLKERKEDSEQDAELLKIDTQNDCRIIFNFRVFKIVTVSWLILSYWLVCSPKLSFRIFAAVFDVKVSVMFPVPFLSRIFAFFISNTSTETWCEYRPTCALNHAVSMDNCITDVRNFRTNFPVAVFSSINHSFDEMKVIIRMRHRLQKRASRGTGRHRTWTLNGDHFLNAIWTLTVIRYSNHEQ